MKILLNHLELENFKGVEKFALQLGGNNAVILGKNGTGKTTVSDAFFWLISDADSNFRKAFNPLLVLESNTPENATPAVARMELQLNTQKIILEKKYSQKWTTKKGSNTPEFTGHTVEHKFNDVPMAQKEYNRKMEDIMPLDLWRCLSDVRYFCGQTTVDYRRHMLLNMAGGIDADTILDANESLESIRHYFEDRSAADIKKMLKLKRRNLQSKLAEIPPRLDELHRSVGGGDSDVDPQKVDERISELDFLIRKASEDQLVKSGATAIIEKKKQIVELSAKVEIEKQEHQRKIDMQYQVVADLKKEEQRLIKDYDCLQKEIADNAKRRAELVIEHQKIDSKEFVESKDCFACGQPLPEDQMMLQREKFNQDQSAKLLVINGKGGALYKVYQEMTDKRNEIDHAIKRLKRQAEAEKKKYETIKADNCCIELLEQVNAIKAEIDENRIEDDPKFEEKIKRLEAERERLKEQKRHRAMTKDKRDRITSLETRQKDLSAELEAIEKDLFLVDEFTRLKTEQIESKVNDLFQLTTWQLFDIQINKEVKKVCEPLADGIKYSSALNTGAKIHIGLDCIQAIGKHYGITMPVFIDNAESITSWPASASQIIKLVADATKDKLEVIQ